MGAALPPGRAPRPINLLSFWVWFDLIGGRMGSVSERVRFVYGLPCVPDEDGELRVRREFDEPEPDPCLGCGEFPAWCACGEWEHPEER